jgi:hypothetical protein
MATKKKAALQDGARKQGAHGRPLRRDSSFTQDKFMYHALGVGCAPLNTEGSALCRLA